MPTANERYRDAALRHQVGLRRYSAGLNKRIAGILEKADAELTAKLRDRLAKFEGKDIDYTGRRWQEMVEEIRAARQVALGTAQDLATGELTELAPIEAAKEIQIMGESLPIQLNFATVAVDQLAAIATARPFAGKLLKEWFSELQTSDGARLIQAIQMGMVQGEPTPDIVRRVIGTRKNQYTDGILSISRRNATAVVRTAVNHVSNTAREKVWEANEDIISARIWTSTLDGRTSAVCRARDGRAAPVGDRPLPEGLLPLDPAGAKPPAHFQCRSTMVAYFDGVGLIGERPTVTDTRTRDKREIDFRRIAKETGKPIQQVRKEWADANVGRVPAKTSYEEFLRRQSAEFQDSVLGKGKGKLFREGGLTLDQFVDRSGNELTLEQLAGVKPKAPPAPKPKPKPKAPPAPKPKAAAPKPNWRDGTEAGEWHTRSFGDAPDWLQRHVATRTVVPGGVKHELPKDKAHFSPREREIDMDGQGLDSPKAQGTWRHEYGHALDWELGGGRWSSMEWKFAAASDKDATALLKNHGAGPWTQSVSDPIWHTLRDLEAEGREAWLAGEFKKAGLNLAEVDDFLTVHTSIHELAGIGRIMARARVLNAWKARDAQAFVDALVAGDSGVYAKGVMSKVTDLFGAATKNGVCDFKRGYWGHSDDYYRSKPGYNYAEVFANLFALAGTRERFAWQIAERFTPESAKEFQRRLK